MLVSWGWTAASEMLIKDLWAEMTLLECRASLEEALEVLHCPTLQCFSMCLSYGLFFKRKEKWKDFCCFQSLKNSFIPDLCTDPFLLSWLFGRRESVQTILSGTQNAPQSFFFYSIYISSILFMTFFSRCLTSCSIELLLAGVTASVCAVLISQIFTYLNNSTQFLSSQLLTRLPQWFCCRLIL